MKFINFIYQKGDKGTQVTRPSPYLPLDPTIPSHVRGACDSASHCMRSILKSLPQILKFMSEHITLPNSVASDNET